MSLSDRYRSCLKLGTMVAVLAMLGIAVAGCQVRPLYSSSTTNALGDNVRAEVSSIAIKEVRTRYGQDVRNHLIFLFNGGQGQPVSPKYDMDLTVLTSTETSASTQTSAEVNEPSAATVILTGTYVITDRATGKPVARGTRQFASMFDVPRQEYASVRAERDAQDRAARELAQLISISVASDLSKYDGTKPFGSRNPDRV